MINLNRRKISAGKYGCKNEVLNNRYFKLLIKISNNNQPIEIIETAGVDTKK